MATGTSSDFILYDEQFYAGQVETLARNVDAFNGASGNTIILNTNIHKGNFEKESFFQNNSHIYDRDPSSVSAQTATKLTMDDAIAPKTSKGYLVENTVSSFKLLGEDSREMSYVLGTQLGAQMMDEFLTGALSALIGCFGVAAVSADLVTDLSTAAITSAGLNTARSKMGDRANRIQMLVMHSTPYFDLIGSQVSDKLLEVTSFNLFQGAPATYGIPVLVTDHPALWSAGSSTASSADDVFNTLGLVRGAVRVQESEEREVLAERVGGKHNLIARVQGEFAYTVRVKGMNYSGAANPSSSALATAGNWTKVAADKRDLMGINLKTR